MTVSMNCAHCGILFTTTNQHAKNGRKYCGSECYRAREMINGPRKLVQPVKFKCKECGKPFTRDPGELRSYHKKYGRDPLYCTVECGGIGRRVGRNRTCKQCGTPMPRLDGGLDRRRVVCSQECRRALKKTQMLAYHAEIKAVPRMTSHGYMRLAVRKAENEKAVQVLMHRHVMEQILGRTLMSYETVHHINGDRSDNRPENLELFNSRHGPGQRVADKVAFAVEILTLYSDFLDKAGYELVAKKPAPDLDALFLPGPVDDVDHPPSVS